MEDRVPVKSSSLMSEYTLIYGMLNQKYFIATILMLLRK